MWQSKAVWKLPVLRAFSASNACFARDEPLSRRVSVIGLRRKPPKLRSWRCTQPRAVKATAGVAVLGKITTILRAAAIVRYTMLASGARNAPRRLATRSSGSDSSQASVGAVV